jgi:hypothetical protein
MTTTRAGKYRMFVDIAPDVVKCSNATNLRRAVFVGTPTVCAGDAANVATLRRVPCRFLAFQREHT